MPVRVVNKGEALVMSRYSADGYVFAAIKALHKSAINIGADEGRKVGNYATRKVAFEAGPKAAIGYL